MRPTPKSLGFVGFVAMVGVALTVVVAGCDKTDVTPSVIKPTPEIPTRDLCSGPGTPCESPEPCCLRQCDMKTGTCAAPLGACKDADDACGSSAECCSGVCRAGKCFKHLCTADSAACKTDDECCGGSCVANAATQGGKICQPLNPTCRTSGNPCAQDTECCSTVCRNGVCQGAASFCKQSGDVCGGDTDCCSGSCTKGAGAQLGTCAAVSTGACKVEGQFANTPSTDPQVPACGGACCSKAAATGGSGLTLCQSPSGCHPTGEVCAADADCCGGATGNARCAKAGADKLGRCEQVGAACHAAGSLCGVTGSACGGDASCCSGSTADSCRHDLLGTLRCTLTAETCLTRPSRVGDACASSADCCGSPCVPASPDAGAPSGDAGVVTGLVCAAGCVAKAGACTATADCCTGFECAVAPGKTTGTCVGGRGGNPAACAFAGQPCKDTTCCSSDLLCNPGSGRCEPRSL